jgi:hypothetical protein
MVLRAVLWAVPGMGLGQYIQYFHGQFCGLQFSLSVMGSCANILVASKGGSEGCFGSFMDSSDYS